MLHAAPDPAAGPAGPRRVLAGRYELTGLLGRGGMADVHRAEDTVLEREVAVKLLRMHAATESDRARFADEMQLLAALDHPFLVAVLDAGVSEEDQPFLVLELVEGRSLAQHCQAGPVAGHRLAPVGAELAAVLGYVHERGIVHRDIKPGNILIGGDGHVKLADFGIARMLGDATGHTLTGTTVGTAAYLAPEQVRGEPVSPASDVYSLGLVLLEALTGRRAYTGAPLEAAMSRLHTAPLIPTSLPTGWPALLTRMSATEPADRPSVTEVAQVLDGLAQQPGQQPEQQSDPSDRPARRATDRPGRHRRPGRARAGTVRHDR